MFGRFRIFIVVLCCAFCAVSNSALAQDWEVLTKSSYDKIFSYLMIEKSDVKKYREAFEAIEKGKFDKANKISAKIDNDILMGHILGEKYLSKSYPTKYLEAKIWLEKYADLPQAARIYSLAVKKGGSSGLTRPEAVFPRQDLRDGLSTDYDKLKGDNRKFVVAKIKEFRKAINQGKTKTAKNILENKRFRQLVPNKNYDEFSTLLATKYLVDGYDSLALEWSLKPMKRSKNASAYWVGGLAAWKKKDYKNSAKYMSKLGLSGNSDDWLVAAGAYWAYRGYDKLGNKTEAQKWLKVAAKYKRTFYGILAEKKLGIPLACNWEALSYLNDFNNLDYINELLASSAMRRAVILLHANQTKLAETELRADYKNMNDKQKEAALYIANQYKMHSLAVMIATKLNDYDKEMLYDLSAYPVPEWKPKSGWKVDKALVWALVRQESAFSPVAKSSAGARGLMQLLPNTAFHITKDSSLKKNQEPLNDVAFNLELGQKYVAYLMDKSFVNNNLFYMMSAYNAGPGNLVKWQKNVNYDDDPLLYIEIIPARETRIYIERVMANYWIYNSRFGRDNYTLEQVAQGEWPSLTKR